MGQDAFKSIAGSNLKEFHFVLPPQKHKVKKSDAALDVAKPK